MEASQPGEKILSKKGIGLKEVRDRKENKWEKFNISVKIHAEFNAEFVVSYKWKSGNCNVFTFTVTVAVGSIQL